MPFRSQEILSQWLEEFLAAGHRIEGAVEVLRQDGADGADTGLVVIDLSNAPTTLYLEPVAPGDPRWAITFLARDVDAARSPQRVAALAAELAVIAELCRHLESRSASWDAPDLSPSGGTPALR
ncbi:hypothetical protein ITJ64_05775 [Herbiconiux sp. VKM Ac-1786]|uniref:hypothetical protein n=1 Tax=Herbiconiux sp. VKM Ac-1786 TaxID=2783824 RepID=UPI00188C9CE5|nr:hypothetical protein [Herbiconiux sp. VKM Ac-1786]MBF4572021.1 hypothetical protein [Herbiconiux sp. VKM Ac-1786]